MMKSQSTIHISASLGKRKWTLFVMLLSFAFQWVAALQNPLENFCRRYGHQSTVIDDKLYIDGGYVNFDSFPQDHLDVPSRFLSAMNHRSLLEGEGDKLT